MFRSTPVSLPQRGVLAVSGDDRATFLQGLTSNDMKRLSPGHALWTAFLTPQGKVQRDAFALEQDGTIYLETDIDGLEAFQRYLLRYRLRAKVEITIKSEWGVAVSPAPSPQENIIAFADPRLATAGYRLLGPIDRFASRSPSPEDLFTAEEKRLRLGLADGARDIVAGMGFLLEYGFGELSGVSFDKGCYIGQETTARMKWKSLVRKRLLPVMIDGPLPLPGAVITTTEGTVAGECRSGLDRPGFSSLALAILRLEALSSSALLRVGDTPVIPVLPGWLRFPA